MLEDVADAVEFDFELEVGFGEVALQKFLVPDHSQLPSLLPPLLGLLLGGLAVLPLQPRAVVGPKSKHVDILHKGFEDQIVKDLTAVLFGLGRWVGEFDVVVVLVELLLPLLFELGTVHEVAARDACVPAVERTVSFPLHDFVDVRDVPFA